MKSMASVIAPAIGALLLRKAGILAGKTKP